MTYQSQENRILDTLGEMEKETHSFSEKSGLRCPSECGACCRSPELEASVTEMIPMAAELIRQDQGQYWLEKLEQEPDQKICVLFEAHPTDPRKGRCRFYQWRPSVCRLFGYAGRRNKQNIPELAACKIHKETCPDTLLSIREKLKNGELTLPQMVEWTERIAHIEPGRGYKLLPINQALREALIILLMEQCYTETDTK